MEPVERSEWAILLVIVPKRNGKLRVCGDFNVTINQCVETIDDKFTYLLEGNIFMKLDLLQAYLQLPIDDDSKDLLVINTHKGLFWYNYLP